MAQTQITPIDRTNQDYRIITAYTLLENDLRELGNYIVYKATRAGATTAFCAEFLNRDQTFLIVVPTNSIAKKTVLDESLAYSDHKIPRPQVVHVPAGHSCILNEKACALWPDLKKLPILPLAEQCISEDDQCEHYNECPVTEILRCHKPHGIALTYHKLSALMLAAEGAEKFTKKDGTNPSTAYKILQKLYRLENYVLDEAHKLECDDTVRIHVATVPSPEISFMPSTYDGILADYPYLKLIIETFTAILKNEDVRAKVAEMVKISMETGRFNRKQTIRMENMFLDAIMEDHDPASLSMAVYEEIIKLTKYRKHYHLPMDRVLDLYKIMCIVLSDTIHVHAMRSRGEDQIFLVALDTMRNQMIRKFVFKIQEKQSRIIFMSATFGSMDYNKFFRRNKPPVHKLFGSGGDPLNNNSKLLIIADNKKYATRGRNSTFKNTDAIIDKIRAVLTEFERNPDPNYEVDDDVIIVCRSTLEATRLQVAMDNAHCTHKVTYYNSPSMLGVASRARVMVAVGLAEKPSTAYDTHRETKEEAMILRKELVHADTWQAWSRVKDPSGVDTSIVFVIGATETECNDVVTWGYNRIIELSENDAKTGYEYALQCKGNITHPKVIERGHITDAMIAALQHMGKKAQIPGTDHKATVLHAKASIRDELPGIVENPYYEIISKMRRNSLTVYTKADLLWQFVIRPDAYYKQTDSGDYVKVDDNITLDILQKHIAGDITIGVLAIGHTPEISNAVQWICIDIDAHANKSEVKKLRQAKHSNSYAALDEYNKMKAEYGDLPELNREFFAKVDQYHNDFRVAVRNHMKKQRELAEERRAMFANTLDKLNVPYLLEASGSRSSYHFWIFLRYVDARNAHDFGHTLIEIAGLPLNTEVNPKQTKIRSRYGSDGGYGNQVKLPLAFHRKHKTWSMIYLNGEFVRDFDKITLTAIDITGFVPIGKPEKDKIEYSAGYHRPAGIRDIFKWCLDQDLTGSDGHMMRMAAVREYYNNGMEDPVQLARLFEKQSDFNLDKSLYHVNSIISQDFACWKKETIVMQCSSIVAKYVESGGRW